MFCRDPKEESTFGNLIYNGSTTDTYDVCENTDLYDSVSICKSTRKRKHRDTLRFEHLQLCAGDELVARDQLLASLIDDRAKNIRAGSHCQILMIRKDVMKQNLEQLYVRKLK